MIFGGWRGILCGRKIEERFYTEATESIEVTEIAHGLRFDGPGFCGGAQELLVQIGDFFVQVGEGGF
jgi:hypothetical protein